MAGGFIGGQVGSRIGLKTKSHLLRRIFVAVFVMLFRADDDQGLNGDYTLKTASLKDN